MERLHDARGMKWRFRHGGLAAMPEGWIADGSGALVAAGAAAVAAALTALFASAFAAAVARSTAEALALAIAIAPALVDAATAVAFVATGAAQLAAAAGVGGLGNREARSAEQGGGEGQDGFGFHVVVLVSGFVVWTDSPVLAMDETDCT
jgi:hypothetical protein